MAKSRFATDAEYVALCAACSVVNALPYRVAIALARALGWAMVRVFGFKRDRTFRRISSVFPDKPRSWVRGVAVSSLQNVLMDAVEMMRAPRLGRDWMDRHVIGGRSRMETLKSYADEGRGVVVMVPHSGNWYMAAWSMAAYGLPLIALAARQRNARIEAWMRRRYGKLETVDRDSRGALAKIRNALAEGRVFAILPDLRVRKRDVEVGFLGGKANVSRAGAMFAVRAGAPIVVAQMIRENGKHAFRHLGTLRPNPGAADVREEAAMLTAEAMRMIDEAVRERPGEWFWYNKRWILEPPER